MNDIWVRGLPGPMQDRTGPVPLAKFQMTPKTYLFQKFQMTPILNFLISSGSKKKEPRYECLSEA